MKKLDVIKKRRERIRYKIRKKVSGTSVKPRLVVYRSAKHIYAQLVDDLSSKTLYGTGSNSKSMQEKLASVKGNVEISKYIGKLIAEKAKDLNISEVVFDRNGYLYHGRVKALADGAREGGLKF
ncbi:MAG: 50S ribosomal protein L18 [Ignavibacteria bacterium]|nr:50S ribosomal protein L18 [Ignavibacteria bacterium]